MGRQGCTSHAAAGCLGFVRRRHRKPSARASRRRARRGSRRPRGGIALSTWPTSFTSARVEIALAARISSSRARRERAWRMATHKQGMANHARWLRRPAPRTTASSCWSSARRRRRCSGPGGVRRGRDDARPRGNAKRATASCRRDIASVVNAQRYFVSSAPPRSGHRRPARRRAAQRAAADPEGGARSRHAQRLHARRAEIGADDSMAADSARTSTRDGAWARPPHAPDVGGACAGRPRSRRGPEPTAAAREEAVCGGRIGAGRWPAPGRSRRAAT